MGNTATPRQAEGLHTFRMRQLQRDLQKLREAPCAFRMLEELISIRHLTVGDSGDCVEGAIETALHFLPDTLGLLADGLQVRVMDAIESAQELDELQRPRFELRPGANIADLERRFFRPAHIELDQEALRTASQEGRLPSCVRVIKPVAAGEYEQ